MIAGAHRDAKDMGEVNRTVADQSRKAIGVNRGQSGDPRVSCHDESRGTAKTLRTRKVGMKAEPEGDIMTRQEQTRRRDERRRVRRSEG